jgi:hypothetical protein
MIGAMALSRGARLGLTLIAALAMVWVATVAVLPRPASTGPAAGGDGDLEALTGPRIAWRGKAPWQISRASGFGTITEAYTDRPSYLPGDILRVAVSTSAKIFNLSIWRLGATPVLMSTSRPISGGRQAAPIVDASTGLVRATWRSRYSVRVPASWPSGIYLVRVHGTGGADSFATFVVRSQRAGSLLFVVNTLTDAAYNTWGGSSLYRLSIPGVTLPVGHALAVSLDRPNSVSDGAGSTFTQQWPLARWLEQGGYDVTYTTDWDLSRDADDAPLPRAVVFAGHSEYWSAELRTWLDSHVVDRPDMGLALFGANTGYWPVTLSADGRTITCFKEAVTDPAYPTESPTEAGELDPSATTAAASGLPSINPMQPLRFRDGDLVSTPSSRRPEQTLFGIQYGSITAGIHQFTISSSVPRFLLDGTDLGSGVKLGAIVGGETDAVDPTAPQPRGQSVIATAYFADSHGTATTAAAVYRSLPGDRGVFAAGTFLWMWGLDPGYAAANGVPAGFATLTRNILAGVTGEPAPTLPAPSPPGSPAASTSPAASATPSFSASPSELPSFAAPQSPSVSPSASAPAG